MTKKRSAPKAKLRAIALKAANKMARKASWCQGSWAETKDGENPLVDPKTGNYDYSACAVPGVDCDYFAANSPRAQKFCVEGMIYNAAGRVFKGMKPGYDAARLVVALLDAKVDADPGTGYDSAMSLNDSNGDASRKRLAKLLREVAKDLA